MISELMDPSTEFTRDMLKTFEDLPPEDFAEFRRKAAELGVPPQALCLVTLGEWLRQKRRERKA